MKQKLFTLLTLLVLCVTGAWGQYFSATPLQTLTENVSFSEETQLTSTYATISGGNMYFETSSSQTAIEKQSSYYSFKMANSAQGFKIVLNQALANGDIISASILNNGSGDSNRRGIYITTSSSRPSSAPTSTIYPASAGSKMYQTDTYTVTTGDGICGESTIYIWRYTSNGTYFKDFTITRPSFTVTYDNNGGTGSISNSTGNPITLSDGTGFTAPTGYSLAGWNTAANGSGTDYTAGQTGVTANLSLYAKWTQTVILDANTANHGSGENGSATAIYNGTALTNISHTTPASGYALSGYFTAATEGTKVLNADGSFAASDVTSYITEDAWTKTGATTLYAQYEEAAKYAVTHTLTNVTTTSGATGANAATQGVEYTAVFAPASYYSLPDAVTVTIGGEAQTEGTGFTYTKATGTVTIPAAKVSGAIVITVAGVRNECADPTITAGAFNFANHGYAVTITNNEEGSTLYYSTNNEDWTEYTSTLYATATTHYYAKSVKANYDDGTADLNVAISTSYDALKKYIAWVYTSDYNSGDGKPNYAFATDPMVIALQTVYNVVPVDYAQGDTPSTDLKNADLIVCTEAMTGDKTMSNGMVNLLDGTAPMIGLKMYNYGGGSDATKRWKWGLPANPASTTYGFTAKNANYKVLDGVTFESDGTIKLATDRFNDSNYKNVVQTANFTGANKPADNAILGTLGSDDTKAVMHYSATKKYFGLGLSSDCWEYYTDNATTIIMNAAAMLIAGDDLTEANAVTQVTGKITAAGWTTFSSSEKLDLSTISGGTAYYASGVNGANAVLTPTGDVVVAAGTGLMIKGTANDAFTIDVTDDAVTFSEENLLEGLPTGGTVEAAGSGFNYVFGWASGHPEAPGFYKVNGTSAVLGSGKAYLHTTAELADPGAQLGIVFEENGEATGIDSIATTAASMDKEVYNLAGQRVAQPTKGLYIVNGKKVVIK